MRRNFAVQEGRSHIDPGRKERLSHRGSPQPRDCSSQEKGFARNLGCCWEQLTGNPPPKSDSGPFANFIQAAFRAFAMPDENPGYYAKEVFSRKKISKAT
jgi:hypothetical protein